MKRSAVVIFILLVSSLLGGCGGPPPSGNENSAIAVKVEQVAKADLKTAFHTSGLIEASTEATIAPKVSGRVTVVNVKMGDRVTKGQVLFQIEAKEARNQLTQSEAGLGIAKAGYDSAVQALKDAQANYDRYQTLYKNGVVSENDLEQATTALVNAKLGLKQAEQQLDQAEAALSTAQENVNDYSVTAPIGGLVSTIEVETGEMVSSQTDAATIVNIDTVKVKASIPESVINTIQTGTKVPVVLESLNKTVEGTVTAISPKANSATMGYPAEVTVANPSGTIKPGMSAQINLFTGIVQDVIVVPVDAVIEKDGQHIAYIVENDKAKEVSLQVGVSSETKTEITEGLTVGQSLVIEGNRLLSDGQLVRVVEEQAGAAE
ncbi:efflux RND transporter periplasmic adaptor subunit [Candidatus Formimonas warabiya]|uniref:Uncharacterized protein n=1 Tax=Formimonas warabiya TaxID=1761012 RepID=A0A3G1KV13_FORW1|nr:efflux RND transporter periplasmic adaptor subunit [Candidatus Formimonas warabiya]ATW26353.1 hypothetical protein DCMF_17715 [Candidatus Formimonas warabiya]